MARVLGILAGMVYLLAILSALLLGAPAAPPEERAAPRAQTPSPNPASADRPAMLPQLVGVNLNVWSTDDLSPYFHAIDRVAEMGFNSIQIVTPIFMTNGSSRRVRIVTGHTEGSSRGLERDQLLHLLRYADRQGLIVSLMPQINFTVPRGNAWRGEISPERWKPWWDSYARVLRRFLEIADEAETELFVVGCELVSTQKPRHRDRWKQLISTCRNHFDGALIYSSTWDTYDSVPFWKQLDAIGVSGYWDLTREVEGEAEPSDLLAAWKRIRKKLLAFSDRHDRPLLITELGYPSLPWALKDPWKYPHDADLEADHAAQRRGYRSFLRGWKQMLMPPWQQRTEPAQPVVVQTPGARWRLPRPGLAGVQFWEWRTDKSGGPDDTSYGFAGKPAEDLLRQWLQPPE